MSYKISIASSEGAQVDLSFRGADYFTIIDVKDDKSYTVSEKRRTTDCGEASVKLVEDNRKANCESGCGQNSSGQKDCGQNGGGCGSGHGGGHSDVDIETRVKIISDCRCLLCKKIGPGAERQLERKAITVFQIDLSVEAALSKIIDYYTKIDNHISLRKN